MSKSLPRKAIIAISSFQGAIYPDGHKTGLFFVEALHPFEVLVSAGFEVDLASETGSFGFDFNSLQPPFLSGSDKAVYNNPDHPFMAKLAKLNKAEDLKKTESTAFSSRQRVMRRSMTTRPRRVCRQSPLTSGIVEASSGPSAMDRQSCLASSTPRPASRSLRVRQ